eukprot:TRINITY_DN1695_c0_g2_i10.p1 TRINITY_DN1695_c0_g2~~TRINITY_DN1695_c0_g2_i10.p1  ORF type:complete len:455 (-),score=74.24 TRINITY_DN1695_c0_g2_i10:1254-2618(-)
MIKSIIAIVVTIIIILIVLMLSSLYNHKQQELKTLRIKINELVERNAQFESRIEELEIVEEKMWFQVSGHSTFKEHVQVVESEFVNAFRVLWSGLSRFMTNSNYENLARSKEEKNETPTTDTIIGITFTTPIIQSQALITSPPTSNPPTTTPTPTQMSTLTLIPTPYIKEILITVSPTSTLQTNAISTSLTSKDQQQEQQHYKVIGLKLAYIMAVVVGIALVKLVIVVYSGVSKVKKTAKKTVLKHGAIEVDENKVLGQGQFGKVYQGKIDGKIKVAVKVMRIRNKKEYKDAVVTEVKIMKSLNHPNVLQIISSSFQKRDQVFYVALELLQGKSLKFHLDKRIIMDTKKVALQLVMALNHCHQNSIAHMDIKPDNIMVDSTQKLKLIDFGLSIRVASEDQQSEKHVGSPMYMASEVLNQLLFYPLKSDMWSAGVVIYEMCCKEVPWNVHNDPTT